MAKLARALIAMAKRGGPMRPRAPSPKRLAAVKPFGRSRPSMKLPMASMPRAPRAPRPFGMPRRRSLRKYTREPG
jgi:hypothetical protein